MMEASTRSRSSGGGEKGVEVWIYFEGRADRIFFPRMGSDRDRLASSP